MRLIRFELAKIWWKRQLLAILCIILLTNILLQWYGSQSTQLQPDLSAYKKVMEKTAGMTEEEKLHYLQTRAEDLENIRVTDQIVTWLGRDTNTLDELSQENQEIVRQWSPIYQKGDYLEYTDSLEHEIALIDELYKEAEHVTQYDSYLEQMQQSKGELSGISIFAGEKKNTFSEKNIEKSSRDYRFRTADNVRWFPGKGVVSALDTPVTGLLFLTSIFVFAVWGIMEEKEKKLFYFTRTTKMGILSDVWARMAALGISCVLISILLYMSNYLFYGLMMGFPDISLDIQSVAVYVQSCYSLTIGQFLVCSILTKAAVGFGFGLLLQFVMLLSRRKIWTFVAGIALLAGNTLLYELLPAVGTFSVFKFINLIGVFHTENLYGDYLNLNIDESPISRTGLSLALIGFLLVAGVLMVTLAFCYGQNFFFLQRYKRQWHLWKPHTNLFRHESYKLFITNRAIVLMAVCLLFSGGYYATRSYPLSAGELYYRDLMEKLEGPLTDKKEALLLAEKKRYDTAMEHLDEINELEEQGKLSALQADRQRDVWNAVLFFYSSFQRAWRQYESIQEQGGIFLYDTGYYYLFGIWGEGFLTELFLFTIGILLIFSNAAAVEFQNKTTLLIRSSAFGMKRVMQKKMALCILVGICLPVCLWIYYIIHIQKSFFLHYWQGGIQTLYPYQNIPIDVPIWLFAIAFVLLRVFVCCVLACCILFLSYWRKSFMQTIIIGAILFVVPLALYAQGVSFMKYFTLLPWYGIR